MRTETFFLDEILMMETSRCIGRTRRTTIFRRPSSEDAKNRLPTGRHRKSDWFAAMKHRVLGFSVIIRSGLRYAFLSKGFLVVEGAALFLVFFYSMDPLAAIVLKGVGTGTLALIAALSAMGGVALLRRVNHTVIRLIDKRFFREAYDGRKILTELGSGLERLSSTPEILIKTVADRISDSLHPTQTAFFLRKGEIDQMPETFKQKCLNPIAALNVDADDLVCVLRMQDSGEGGRERRCDDVVLFADSMNTRELGALADGDAPWIELNHDSSNGWMSLHLEESSSGPGANAAERRHAKRNARILIPLRAHGRFLGFISLGEKRSEEPYGKEDRELLATVAHQAALALIYAGLIRNEAEQMRVNDEIAIARRVQEKLFPQRTPRVAGLEYVGVCKPARGVGGDCYDFIDLGHDRLGIALGDVAGKGVSAALLMASLQAMLRIHAHAHGDNVARLISDINELLCDMTEPNRFATFFYGVYDGDRETLTYVNAGHNPPLLLRSSGKISGKDSAKADRLELKSTGGSASRLSPTGMVLGVLPEAVYGQETIPLQSGDVLVCYTDGFTETSDANGMEYGEGRVCNVLAAASRESPAVIRDRLFADVAGFDGEDLQHDDMTLVVIKKQ